MLPSCEQHGKQSSDQWGSAKERQGKRGMGRKVAFGMPQAHSRETRLQALWETFLAVELAGGLAAAGGWALAFSNFAHQKQTCSLILPADSMLMCLRVKSSGAHDPRMSLM